MTKAEQLALVVKLACETQDRTPDEQRALMAVAFDVDAELASFLGKVICPHGYNMLDPKVSIPIRPWLFDHVIDTYRPGSDQRLVTVPKAQVDKYRRLIARYDEAAESVGR